MGEATLGPGAMLGSYEILDEVGRGGLGVVYRSRHVHLGRLVALKVLHPWWTRSTEFVDRFRKEGRVMALLDHPHILRVHDAGESGGVFFLAMSYIEGSTLEALIQQGLSQDEALRICCQIGKALAYAHRQGIIHRDVKPANVILDSRGDVILTDFGVARLRDAPGVTLPGTPVGTPFYMAPEQIQWQKADHRADLYSLGVVLYQMLSGALPFPGPTTEEVYEGHVRQEPPSLGEQHPEWLRRVVRKALAKSPDERFADAESFLQALETQGASLPEPDSGDPTTATLVREPPELQHRQGGPDTASGSAELVKEDRTALTLDVVDSSRMKLPGLTLVVQQQFALLRDYVRGHLEAHACLACIWSGDGLLALFARPSQGAACAAAILDGLAEFNASNLPPDKPMRVRIGVHHGPVLMSFEQPLGEVTSRTLDLAGHLQKTSPDNCALISEGAFFGLPDNRNWEPAGAEYVLVFPFRVYRYAPHQAKAAGAGAGSLVESAAPPEVLRLEVSAGHQHKELTIRGEALIGRPHPGSPRVPEIDLGHDTAVSRRHARILHASDGFYLEDLDSANGTSVNGRWLRPSSPALLKPGDVIELGEETVLRVLSIS
jgi:serine/threonine protein kinase